MKLTLIILLSLLIADSAYARSQRCKANKQATAPTADFKNNGDGTVTHLKTGLIWKRCAEGQTGDSCEGQATPFYWDDAIVKFQKHWFANSGKWRIATIDELKGIVEKRCKGPSFNLDIFPNAPTTVLWSVSGVDGRDDKAWQMYSPSGVAIKSHKGVEARIRLVRDPQ